MGSNFHRMGKPTNGTKLQPYGRLGTAACAAAFHTFVTATVTNHDRAASVASGCISHIHETAHGVGGMDQAAIFHAQTGLGLTMAGMDIRQNAALRCSGCPHAARWLMLLRREDLLASRRSRLRSESGKQRQLG